ncbi:MAG: hypothetical protein M0037_07195 [Betaproteobacteria bacterium]|nr:hypothetical protein [Betaproteobacteria bacterium]
MKTKTRACADIAGQRFGMLTALHPTEERRYRTVVWACRCECGGTRRVALMYLRNGATTHCGCLSRSAAGDARKRAVPPGRNRSTLSGSAQAIDFFLYGMPPPGSG